MPIIKIKIVLIQCHHVSVENWSLSADSLTTTQQDYIDFMFSVIKFYDFNYFRDSLMEF